MPVYDIAANRTYASPIRSYYQGKALRADTTLREKQADALQMEIDSAPAAAAAAARKEQREAEEHQWAREKAEEARVQAQREGWEHIYDATGKAAGVAVNGEYEDGGYEAFFQTLETLVEPEAAAAIREKVDPDGNRVFGPKELVEVNALAEVGGYGLDENQTKAQNFADADGNITGSYLEGTPEYDAALADPNQFLAGNVSQTQKTRDLTVEGARTGPQEGKDVQDFLNNVVGASSAVMTGTELLDIAFTNPESIGVPGKFMTWGGNLVEGSKSLMDWAGMEFKPGTDIAAETELQKVGSAAFTYDTWDTGKLGISGAEATKFQAGVYGIAFAAAVAEQGTRPTDKDIQQFIDQIGGRSSNPKAFRDTIFQFMRRQDQRLNIIADTKGIEGVDRERAFATWTPRYRDFVLKYATTSGLTAGRDPDTGEVQIIYATGKKETF